jgi:hypothetical protein
MSERWPGGIVRSTPVTPTGPLQNGTAPGVWTLADAAYWTKQGLWPLAGNILAVEDVFSTYLYDGNGGTQTITNGMNLSGQGGMVWVKQRNSAQSHRLYDTSRGVSQMIASNTTSAQANTSGFGVTNFANNGFTLVDSGSNYGVNFSGQTYASWTFREAPKFFDIVTYTGNGVSGRQIAHSLGSTPGCIMIKATSVGGTPSGWISPADWWVYHRGLPSPGNFSLRLNTTAAENNSGGLVASATTFTVYGATPDSVLADNVSGVQYVAYLFAHDTASTGLIQCGGYAGTGAVQSINLGWEPQWLLVKNVTNTGNWNQFDNMRGMAGSNTGSNALLNPNLSNAESTTGAVLNITATGFTINNTNTNYNGSGENYIYIAIRRGPMKTPTLGTSVFAPIARNGTDANAIITTGFTVDLHISKTRTVANSPGAFDRLRGAGNFLNPASTAAQDTVNFTDSLTSFANNTGDGVGADSGGGVINFGTRPYANWTFSRAPGFFDVVAYTGTGSATAFNHNLGVVPELMIVKSRSLTVGWQTYSAALANTEYLELNTTAAKTTGTTRWNSTTPSATTFTLGTAVEVNNSGSTYMAYLFASAPGVSKVGSYTGTGALQTINCAFTTGARFVLIKRTDSTGDWFVWDSARGISSGNDPYLLLNSTAVEATGTNFVDTTAVGFQVTAAAPAGVNASGGSYIFLAIA